MYIYALHCSFASESNAPLTDVNYLSTNARETRHQRWSRLERTSNTNNACLHRYFVLPVWYRSLSWMEARSLQQTQTHRSEVKMTTAAPSHSSFNVGLPQPCEHKADRGCMMTAVPCCCSCADKRPHATAYPMYVDGTGMVMKGRRWQRYCRKCYGKNHDFHCLQCFSADHLFYLALLSGII